MHEPSLKQIQKEWHGTLKSYLIGFFSSLILTIASFYLTIFSSISRKNLFFTLVVLALMQASLQLRFFLHLGQEPKPKWETVLFIFMLLLLFIIAFGTLWIMNDLNNRMMMSHD